MENQKQQEYLSAQEAEQFKKLFTKYLHSYKGKSENITDEQWLENTFLQDIPDITQEQAKNDAKETMQAIFTFDANLAEIDESAQHGVSKEQWLSNKLNETSTGMSINEYGHVLQGIDDALYQKNIELSDALTRSRDGQISMNPNLDGNIAEHMIAGTTELSGVLQKKNIQVKVCSVFSENSVDVRARNLDTGQYQNYQLKFGKDAKATIELIERGNYNNQRIVVPKEQLAEIQEHFRAKGSNKTITDRIEAWGVEGKSYTKQEMKDMQNNMQQSGFVTEMDYNQFSTKDLALSIGKNAGVMGIQSAAVTSGMHVAQKIFQGETVDADEMVTIALQTGADTSVKVISAGALQVAVKRGIISFIPKATPAGIIANIACVGIENIKVLGKILSGELSMTQGLDRMGRITTSMVGGLIGAGKGAFMASSAAVFAGAVIGGPLAVVAGLVGGTVGYLAGSSVGDGLYEASKAVAKTAVTAGKAAVEGLKSAVTAVGNVVTGAVSTVAGWFGL